MTPPGVRLAGDNDVPSLARTLALAHDDYAWAMWAFPTADRFELLVDLFRLDLQIGVRLRSVWACADACVAIWSPPTTAYDGASGSASADAATLEFIAAAHDQQALLIDQRIGARADRLASADALTRPHHPPQPYWYLGTIGTRPDARGRGLATTVLQPALDRCDDDRTPACLETSSDANVRLYARLGFEPVCTTTSDDGQLPLIVMVRTPR